LKTDEIKDLFYKEDLQEKRSEAIVMQKYKRDQICINIFSKMNKPTKETIIRAKNDERDIRDLGIKMHNAQGKVAANR
jgi:hypothetical protein